jgi:hypothetical protein
MERPLLVPLEDDSYDDSDEEGLDEQIKNYKDSLKTDKRLRISLFVFTIVLVIVAPFASWLYPSAWTYILSTALAFTIGTNLLISIVSVRVEDKADLMESRMVELLTSLNTAASRLEEFHLQLDGINIPAVLEMVENVRDEVAPGLRSLDDLDIGLIIDEINRGRAFFDTLDMDKVSAYLSHIRKEGVDGRPLLAERDPEYGDYWGESGGSDNSLLSMMMSESEVPDSDVDVLSRIMQ